MPLAFIDEATLCGLLRSRDREAFTYLYDYYGGALMGELVRLVGDEAVAENLLQDVFVIMYRTLDSHDPQKSRLFTWMLTVTRNCAIGYLRSVDECIQTLLFDPGIGHEKAELKSTLPQGQHDATAR